MCSSIFLCLHSKLTGHTWTHLLGRKRSTIHFGHIFEHSAYKLKTSFWKGIFWSNGCKYRKEMCPKCVLNRFPPKWCVEVVTSQFTVCYSHQLPNHSPVVFMPNADRSLYVHTGTMHNASVEKTNSSTSNELWVFTWNIQHTTKKIKTLYVVSQRTLKFGAVVLLFRFVSSSWCLTALYGLIIVQTAKQIVIERRKFVLTTYK